MPTEMDGPRARPSETDANRPLVGRDEELARAQRAVAGSADLVVIAGEPGIGKTRLAREVLRRSEARGAVTAWVSATRSGRDIPLGAFSPLLGQPERPHRDRLAMLQWAHAAIIPSDGRELVLAVDDVDLLDEVSLALLPVVVHGPGATLLITHRTERAPDAVVDLERSIDRSERIDLQRLGRMDGAELAERLLGAPLLGPAFDLLWGLSQGNPLFLNDLVRASQEEGTLEMTPDGLTFVDAPVVSRRLTEIVQVRLGQLSHQQREVLETLALHEPVGLDLAIALVPDEDFDELEERRLVEVELAERRRQARLAHPVYGEVLRSALPAGRRARIAARLASEVEAAGARRQHDALALVRLRTAANERVGADLLLSAGRQALSMFDHQRAAELARRAVGVGGGTEADLLLGEALTNMGQITEADDVLSSISWEDDEDAAARAALTQARNRLFVAEEPSEAQAVVEEALRHVRSAGWRDELEAMLALCTATSSDLEAAIRLGDRIVRREDASDRAVLSVLVVSTLADALYGRLGSALSGIDRGLQIAPTFQSQLPFSEAQLRVNEGLVHWFQGDFELVERAMREHLGGALADNQVDPAVLYGFMLSLISLERGRSREALRVARDALARTTERSAFGLESSIRAVLGRAAVAAGDLDEAEAHLEWLVPRFDRDVRARLHGGRAQVWLAAARGRMNEAAELAADEGRWATETHQHLFAICTYYDAVRFGRPELVVDDLGRLVDEVEGGLVTTFHEHARARVAGDAAALEDVSARLAGLGAMAYAAEAASHAADGYRRSGDRRNARRASAAAASLVADCEGPNFPTLAPAVHDPLTPREEEVGRMAATGATSREIAERLVVSVRTVDNHLASVYRKTGIGGRGELPHLFDPTTPSE